MGPEKKKRKKNRKEIPTNLQRENPNFGFALFTTTTTYINDILKIQLFELNYKAKPCDPYPLN